jgi:hypothetical protein
VILVVDYHEQTRSQVEPALPGNALFGGSPPIVRFSGSPIPLAAAGCEILTTFQGGSAAFHPLDWSDPHCD